MEPIVKQLGNTASEKFLVRLCTQSFLDLWCYPSVFRDQRAGGRGDGKEVCDILVVFGDDVIIFSDKECDFKSSSDLGVDWSRWYRKAIQKSAEQLWGAERWIREHPDRLFLDRACQRQLPVTIPGSGLRVHRVVVANGVSESCRELLGGSGTCFIMPSIKGHAHYSGPFYSPDISQACYETWHHALRGRPSYAPNVLPFAVGDVDPDRGFVHVFDEAGISFIMNELDTVSDIVMYLKDRETYLRGWRLHMAAGEEDLLAHYLTNINGFGWRAFAIPDEPDRKVMIPSGEWEAMLKEPQWKARKDADEISYVWDQIIGRFTEPILDGTSLSQFGNDFAKHEQGVRALAREPRFFRRLLAEAFVDFMVTKEHLAIQVRLFGPILAGQPKYIFLTARPFTAEAHDHYRKRRFSIAAAYAIEATRKYDDATEVIVLATEPRDWKNWSTEDVWHIRADLFSEEDYRAIDSFVEEQGILRKTVETFRGKAIEYPNVKTTTLPPKRRNKSVRNSECVCGSGRKYKKCCMR